MVTMQQKQVHLPLTEHVQFVQKEVTVILKLPQNAQDVLKDKQQLRKEAPTVQIAKVVKNYHFGSILFKRQSILV